MNEIRHSPTGCHSAARSRALQTQRHTQTHTHSHQLCKPLQQEAARFKSTRRTMAAGEWPEVGERLSELEQTGDRRIGDRKWREEETRRRQQAPRAPGNSGASSITDNKRLSAAASSTTSPPASHCLRASSGANMRRLASLSLLLVLAATTTADTKSPNEHNSFNSELSAPASAAAPGSVWSNEQWANDAAGLLGRNRAHVDIGRRHRRQAGKDDANDDPQSLWAHLRSNYPSLVGHLLARARKQANERSQMARSVAKLLEEAERVVSLANLEALRAFGGKTLDKTPSISRLSLANPAYAKLVQQLHHRQRHHHFARPSAVSTPPPEIANHELGRLVHYPRELEQLGGESGVISTSRSLDKLRQLNDAIERVSQDNEAIESNRIPSGADGWPQKQHSSASSGPRTDDKFVYGNLLFRPQHQASPEVSSTRRLMQSLRGRANDTRLVADDAGTRRPTSFGQDSGEVRPSGGAGDELAKQLEGQVAVAPADDLAATAAVNGPVVLESNGPDEEFEGQWLSAPIEQVQVVRQARRDEVAEAQAPTGHTTPGPRDVFVVD